MNMKLQKLTQHNIELIKPYLERENTRNCEYSFGTKEMWRRSWDTKFAFIGDSLVFWEYFSGHEMFYCPLGDDREAAFLEIEDYCIKNNLLLCYICVPEELLPVLTARYGENVEIKTGREWSDYLYLAEDLIKFQGKKYQDKRNLLNRYKKTYGEPDFHIATADEKEKILSFYDKFMEQTDLPTKMAKTEAQYAREVLSEAWDIGLTVGYVQNADGIVAICVGEVRRDTLYVHIEKALYSVKGSYQAIVNSFTKAMATDGVKYVNREDDAGDEGLRASKKSYNPIALLNKYCVIVDNVGPRLKENDVNFESERLSYQPFTLETVDAYTALATDDENNRLWGYDYREDLQGEKADAAHFWKMLSTDRAEGTEFSFAVTEKQSGKIIGELVARNFDGAFGCEVGVRIAKEYQGKGYGREAWDALADQLFKLGIHILYAKAYKQNEPSKKMIENSGFIKADEDDEFVYYRKVQE